MIFRSNNTNLHIVNAVAYLTFPDLEKYKIVNHAFSTRIGGVSEKHFKSMNLSFSQGDKRDSVIQNYKIFCDAAGFELESIIATSQDHGDNIRIVEEKDEGVGISRPQDRKSVDGLLTNCKGVTLATYHADCTPIYFLDPKKEVIGLAHSGWRGTAKRIAANMIEKMTKNFSCKFEDIICVIGPCIDKCCYEVGEDVYKEFLSSAIKNTELFVTKSKKAKNKYILDLKEANKQILLQSNIKEKNIFISDICTCCFSDLLFSQRAMGNNRGTLGAFFSLKVL
jgi:YfiH family protein